MDRTGIRRHLRLVTEADRILYEGPITRLGLWPRYQPVDYNKITKSFLAYCVLLRVFLFWAFDS